MGDRAPLAGWGAHLAARLEREETRLRGMAAPALARLCEREGRSAAWSGEQRYAWRALAFLAVLALMLGGSRVAPPLPYVVLLGLGLFLPLLAGPRAYAAALATMALAGIWLTPGPAAGLPLAFTLIGLAGAHLPFLLALPAAAVAAGAYLLPPWLAGQGGALAQYGSLFLATFAGTAGVHQRRVARSRQLVMLAELERSHAELRLAHEQLRLDSERALQLAAAEERERIAREVHDVLAHTLTVLVVQLGAVKRLAARDPERAQEQLDLVAQVARDGLGEVRRSIHALRAADEAGAEALQHLVAKFAARTEVACTFRADAELPPLPPAVSKALYRVTQEALTNAVRHGNARHIEVKLGWSGDGLRLAVRDDGLGAAAAPPVAGGGNGLPGAAERLRAVGGLVRGAPTAGGGFLLEASVPASALQPAGSPDPSPAAPAAERERRP